MSLNLRIVLLVWREKVLLSFVKVPKMFHLNLSIVDASFVGKSELSRPQFSRRRQGKLKYRRPSLFAALVILGLRLFEDQKTGKTYDNKGIYIALVKLYPKMLVWHSRIIILQMATETCENRLL